MDILLCFLNFLLILERGYAVRHRTNLVWSMSPLVNGRARIVGIEGDPNQWIPSGNVTVRHISAPHSAWQFRGLAFHYKHKMLYWSEKSKHRIQGLMLVNRSTSTQTIFTGTSKTIDGLAVDWVSNNLYSVDPKYNWIMMIALKENMTENTAVYKLVVKTDLDNPHGLAVHPQKGYLFWSDWGFYPKIEVSDLLGLNRRTIVSDNMLTPRGITIDYKEKLLYWVDSQKNTIESVQFNGNSRRIIVSHAGAKFFGVAVFEKYIFATEQLDGHLRIYDKNTGKGYINYQLGYIPYDIMMYDEESQAGNSSECDELNCDQICVNLPLSGPRCYCGDGYEMQEDQKTCEEAKLFLQPAHIYAIRDAICQYPANFGHMSLKNITLDKQCFIKTRKGFMALAYDGDQRTLFYSENVTKSISKVQLKRGEYTKSIIKGIGEVKGLAFDWMTKNLYWTDSKYQWIMVARPDGRFQKKLINENLVDPVGIVVHPKRGELYWSDPGRHVVEVSALNGGGRRNLVVTNIDHPNHLYLDFTSDVLYWADSGLNQVVSYDLDLDVTSVVYKHQSARFYGISLFQDYLVWTDQNDMNGIHIADIQTQNKVRGILHPQTGEALDVIAYDVINQPVLDVTCSDNNGYCDQLCLGLYNESYVCACGTGFQLDKDLQSCLARDNFVIAADSYQKQLYQVDLSTGDVHVIAPEIAHNRPIAVAFDPIRNMLYWTENDRAEGKVIQRVNVEGRSSEIIKALSEDSVVDGLALDHINRLLFYTDTGLDRIQVVSIDNYQICKTVVKDKLDEPRAIAIHPLKGKIFWSDWGNEPKIESANMDGTERRLFLSMSGIAWPNGLIIDYEDNVLYWVDAKQNTIESISIDGTDRRIVVHETDVHYFGITLVGNQLILSDWKSNSLKTINKSTRNGGSTQVKPIGPAAFSRLNGLTSYDSTSVIKGASGCTGVFTCDHICIPLPRLRFICACADGYQEQGSACIKTDPNATSIDARAKHNPKSSASSKYITYSNTGLSKGGVIAIAVVCVVAFIITIIAAMFLFTRWRSGRVRHERLVDSGNNQVDNFYRITFPDKHQESVSFDSGIDQYDQNQSS
ncbi:low-density lipoprotein receptor-related protein 4-like isoform X2 [Ostrea edulis]|uniref:low-density lipoprotein receptor-related protein 4-like isoform X2 n=1 Tax=Ostrea edulis TaxID=37623 RepID=UPI0024AF7938|nr:low-density lipoprotein receptor-related protein 4-like isoform X2 [Ostrea edulis]